MEDFLTASQAAKLLQLHVKRVQALARAGNLPAVRVGRKWLFRRSQLEGHLGRKNHAGRGRPANAGSADVEISGRNQFKGKVVGVAFGGVMAEVRVMVDGNEIAAIITRSSVDRLGIKVGDEVVAIVKATDVMIGKP
jgi:molybdopterin-binding protein